MRNNIFLYGVLILWSIVLVFVGCTTNAQRTEFNTISSLEQTATKSVSGYFTLVIKGIVATNDVPAVSLKFNQFQAAAKLAADATQSGTNAMAPANLVLELTDLTTLISTIEAKK